MFHVGQHVVTRVASLVPSSHAVVLSLCPRELHRGWLHTDVTASSVVLAAVQSDEEKVYAMDVGIDKVRAVLPKSSAHLYEVASNGGRPLGVGQVVRCYVVHHSSNADGTMLQLSADPNQISAHRSDPRHMSLDTAMPGSQFQVTITRSVTDGWKVRVGSKWTALVYLDHVSPGLELTVDSTHSATLLYVEQPYKTMYMSLLPRLCSPEPPGNPFLAFKLGAKLRNAKVEAVKGNGLLMALRPGKRGFVSGKRALEGSTWNPEGSSMTMAAQLLQHYQPGTTQPCCILDYNFMDQLYICTTEPEVLQAKYLFPSDLTLGQHLTCQITMMKANGALVTLEVDGCPSSRPLRGFVPMIHMADVPLTQPGKKYQPGTRWTARVLSTAEETGLRLTLKPSLISSTLPPLTRYMDAIVGNPYDGNIVMVSPKGLLVLFYGDVKGFVPQHGLSAEHNPQRDFHVGKTVRVYVSRILPEEQQMSLTLLPPSDEELSRKANPDSVNLSVGLPKSKQSPGRQPKLKQCNKGLKKSKPASEEPIKGNKKSKLVSEEPVKGNKKSKAVSKEPVNGNKKSKPASEQPVNGSKKSKPVSEQPLKGNNKSKPVSEQPVKGNKKSKPKPELCVKGLKKSKPTSEQTVKRNMKSKLVLENTFSGLQQLKLVLEHPVKINKKSKVIEESDVFSESLLIKEEEFSDDDRPESQSSSVEFVPLGMLSRDSHPSPEQPESILTEIKSEPEDNPTNDQSQSCFSNGVLECVEIISESENESVVHRKKSKMHFGEEDEEAVSGSEGIKSGTCSSTIQSSRKKKRKAVNGLDDSVKIKKPRSKVNGETPIESDPGQKPCLSLKGGFVWDANLESLSALMASHTRGEDDSSDDELQEPSLKRQTTAERREAARAEEQRLRALETASEEVPRTADDFDRLVMSVPNCSLHWTRYMAHHLAGTEVDKARAVGRKALKTISFREDQERLNVWLAMLNLENLYGSPESLDEVLKEAVKMNEPVKVYTEVLDMFAVTGKSQDAAKLTATITKKHRDQPDLWVGACRTLLKLGEVEKARALLPRALKSLHNKQHVALITKFAQLEQQLGDPTRGQTLLEQVLTSYPRRVDVWNVYVDMLVKHGSLDLARQVLDRAVGQKLGAHKMKALYKKYLAFEEKHGTSQDVARVRQLAFDYVEGLSKTA